MCRKAASTFRGHRPINDATGIVAPATGITTLELNLGTLDDSLRNTSGLAAQAPGADGQDLLVGSGADDQLSGGPGADVVQGRAATTA